MVEDGNESEPEGDSGKDHSRWQQDWAIIGPDIPCREGIIRWVISVVGLRRGVVRMASGQECRDLI